MGTNKDDDDYNDDHEYEFVFAYSNDIHAIFKKIDNKHLLVSIIGKGHWQNKLWGYKYM